MKKNSMNVSPRYFIFLAAYLIDQSAFASDGMQSKINAAASFYLENHTLPTSKRGQIDLDLNEFRFKLELPIQPNIRLTIQPEISRSNKDLAGSKTNDQQIRFRSATLNRKLAETDFDFSFGLLASDSNEKVFQQSQNRRWLHPQLRPMAERYRLISESDLGMRASYETTGLGLNVSYINGEGQGPEAGTRKAFQIGAEWNQIPYFQAKAFYYNGADETYIAEITKIEVYGLTLRSDVEIFSLAGSYLQAVHPADRLTVMKAWSGIDLLAFANQSVKGSAAEVDLSVELGRILPFIKITDNKPINTDSGYSFRQQFYGIAYDLGPNENTGLFAYRLQFNEKHSLQSKEQDGFGISYGLFLE